MGPKRELSFYQGVVLAYLRVKTLLMRFRQCIRIRTIRQGRLKDKGTYDDHSVENFETASVPTRGKAGSL